MAGHHRGQENNAENAANRLAARAELRRDKIAARLALPAATHARLSAELEAHLKLLLRRCHPAIVGYCWPIRGEFDCRPLVIELLSQEVRACLPLVIAAGSAMEFREWQPGAPMLVDRYGIHHPAGGKLLIPDLLLMPVNAFDSQGYRLGYGGGYFDRTLAALDPRPLAVGVGFELARVASTLPGAHDIALDAVVTEGGASFFSPRLAL